MAVVVRPKENSATFLAIRRNENGELIKDATKILCDMIVSGETKHLFLDFYTLIENKLVSLFIGDGDFSPKTQVSVQEATSLGASVEIEDDVGQAKGPVRNDQPNVGATLDGASSKKTPPQEKTEKLVWSDQDTSKLLQLYKDFMNEVGPMKKFKNKKAMWEFIASDLTRDVWKVDGGQCENRFKTVKKRKINAAAHNNTTGEVRAEVPFENEFAEIQAVDDSMVPLVLRGQGKVVYPKNPTDGRQETSGGDPLKSTDRATVSKITKKRKPNPNIEILKHIQMNLEAKKLRHDEKKAHMDQLAADRKSMLELKRKELELREQKNDLIRLALKKNRKEDFDFELDV